jgi:hypothetical protein
MHFEGTKKMMIQKDLNYLLKNYIKHHFVFLLLSQKEKDIFWKDHFESKIKLCK